MNLKQFKESINIGDNILLISSTIPVPEAKLSSQKKMRQVSYKDTTGFYLKGLTDTGRGSFCEWPKASELTVTGDTFTIKDSFGERVYQRFNK
jgi:hypothetical protein